jgi:hypothetical protein
MTRYSIVWVAGTVTFHTLRNVTFVWTLASQRATIVLRSMSTRLGVLSLQPQLFPASRISAHINYAL